ncbi:hypothetical protein B5X24_HaOG211257 [Helicoverpa armigera]|uniref:Uncharacterized protein n=1 Tax=Helicoverpa armigera TaxID=29058 RepID=A0A2W1BL62_HELAM|nr:hypothetical protein B5X24_HaOG211257 [Helicoverpa armigera]
MKSLVSADKIAGASDIRARSGPLPPCARRLGTPSSVASDLFRVSRLQPRSSLQRIQSRCVRRQRASPVSTAAADHIQQL